MWRGVVRLVSDISPRSHPATCPFAILMALTDFNRLAFGNQHDHFGAAPHRTQAKMLCWPVDGKAEFHNVVCWLGDLLPFCLLCGAGEPPPKTYRDPSRHWSMSPPARQSRRSCPR